MSGEPKLAVALDYGTKRIGVAATDGAGITAQPVEMVLLGKDPASALDRITAIIAERKAGYVVIGLPRHMNNDESEMALAAKAFGALLAERTPAAIEYWDERWTSRIAEQALAPALGRGKKKREARNAGRIDIASAQILLQSWMEATRDRDDSEAGTP